MRPSELDCAKKAVARAHGADLLGSRSAEVSVSRSPDGIPIGRGAIADQPNRHRCRPLDGPWLFCQEAHLRCRAVGHPHDRDRRRGPNRHQRTWRVASSS